MPPYEWDEAKRLTNLVKHGFDFRDARRVYEHPMRVTVRSDYRGEVRYVDLAAVGGQVLALTYTLRGGRVRVISLRPAKRKERRIYEEGTQNR